MLVDWLLRYIELACIFLTGATLGYVLPRESHDPYIMGAIGGCFLWLALMANYLRRHPEYFLWPARVTARVSWEQFQQDIRHIFGR